MVVYTRKWQYNTYAWSTWDLSEPQHNQYRFSCPHPPACSATLRTCNPVPKFKLTKHARARSVKARASARQGTCTFRLRWQSKWMCVCVCAARARGTYTCSLRRRRVNSRGPPRARLSNPPLFSTLQELCDQAGEILCKIWTCLHLYGLTLQFRKFGIFMQNMTSTPWYPLGYQGVFNMQPFAYVAVLYCKSKIWHYSTF